MQVTSLIVNGRRIDGLENATVKITINNVSPITMTGDSVAFSATVKVPRTPNNDETFIGLNKGLLNCEYYSAQLQIASIPFTYMSYVTDTPAEFYAKVSATETEYSINLIESTDKWADVSKPISTLPQFENINNYGQTASAANLAKLVRDYFDFPQNDFPPINPYYTNGLQPVTPLLQRPTIMCAKGEVSWDNNVATGKVNLTPRTYTKGRGGYLYPGAAQLVLDNAQIYMYASYFGDRTGGGPAGFLISSGANDAFWMIVEYTGASIPSTKPVITLRGVTSAIGRSMSYAGQITDRIWVYTTPLNASLTVYPKVDAYMQLVATIGGVTRVDYFKFPDGYAPGELMKCGEGIIVNDSALRPQYNAVSPVAIDFPYTDVKNIVDDLCTAWHWRKIYKNGVLSIEPVVAADLRDDTNAAFNHIHDWSDKLRSIETIDVPDDFADQYICTLDSSQFSYSNGAGTVTPIKEAYKSAVKFAWNERSYPQMIITARFNGGSINPYPDFIKQVYYPYINRHFKMFRSRVQVKIKAQLEYADVENLRLGDAYYFSQLNSCFYIKSLGEFDVSTGECKLSLYKMDLK